MTSGKLFNFIVNTIIFGKKTTKIPPHISINSKSKVKIKIRHHKTATQNGDVYTVPVRKHFKG
jgi:hypothetical protein